MTDYNNNKSKTGFEKNKNFIPFDQLTDTPSRIFRMVMDKLQVNGGKWRSLMGDHLRLLHPDDSGPAIEVKKARGTTLGNANQAYFFNKALSFNKLIEGLKILKIRKVTIRFQCELENGEEFEVSEVTLLRSSRSSELKDPE